jgi:hypothetical protein
MREVTFSRHFPAYHPNKGEKTNFVEKITSYNVLQDIQQEKLTGVIIPNFVAEIEKADFLKKRKDIIEHYLKVYPPKLHTIRQGKKFKVGDYIKPMVWAGRPYHKTPEGLWKIQFCDPLLIVQVYDFEYTKSVYLLDGKELNKVQLEKIANNDGLPLEQFECWFNKKEFSGQVICWGKVDY